MAEAYHDWTDRDLVTALEDARGLTAWEIDFTESLVRRLAEGLELTPKQRTTCGLILDDHPEDP